MDPPQCPYCKSTKNISLKTWTYGFNGNTRVEMIRCSCKRKYRFYRSAKSTWTIPKNLKKKKA